VDFTLTDEQETLRATARSVLARVCPPALVREVFEAGPLGQAGGGGATVWARLRELDWPALAVPARYGGLGGGFVELALVCEELGRVVAPGPFMATATQFTPALVECAAAGGADGLLPDVAAGSITGALAWAEETGRWDLESVTTTARPDGDGWVLDGAKSFVPDGGNADWLAVVARHDDQLGLFALPREAVGCEPLPVLDPTQPLARVTLQSVRVPPTGVVGPPGPETAVALTRALEQAVGASAAATVGTCRAIFDRTLQYAKDREQYGRPIGSFQAIKHRLVDMYLALERAAALVAFAALTIAEDDHRREWAPAMAKAAAGDCQRLVVEDGLQLHGGIGFTWDNDLQMLLKRAKTGDLLFGSARTQRAAVARSLGVYG
jgi:alkylation response protein AidB-like acyl-CoA dehydrogenase